MKSRTPAFAALSVVFALIAACGTEADQLFGDSSNNTSSASSGASSSSGGGNNTGGGSNTGGSNTGGMMPNPVCGDLLCQTGENPDSCPADCKPVCGDGQCNGGEDVTSCPSDCPAVCGDGQCGGGETPGSCPADCMPVCGDNTCSMGETNASCPQDCPAACGDGACNGMETNMSCPQDCLPCAHPVCQAGDKLALGCGDPCVDMVCAQDTYCCDTAWDGQCVGAVKNVCGTDCCGDGMCSGEDCNSCPQDCGACPPPPECAHSVCVVGALLDPTKCFDPCVDETCMADAACCMGSPPAWNGDCTILAQMTCGPDPCVSAVCMQDPSCCDTDWTQACVDLAAATCMVSCTCAHPVCAEGPKLDPACDPCAAGICAADPYCCDNNWDNLCVGEVASICGINCN